jgi:hypothetical protein
MKDKAMNRFFALMIVVCAALSSGNAWAGPITEGQARNIAANFMASHAIPSTNLRMAHKAPKLNAPAANANAAYYAFNASHGGFVIVAGDDRVPPVLGYSDKSAFDPQDIPEAMQTMLEGYAAQIDALDHGAKAAPHFVNGNAIAPLVKAQWDQDAPYNLLFPTLNNGRTAYVGCVATAMAQVLYYWKWPVRTTIAIHAYTSPEQSIYMPQLPVINFAWDKMQDTYQMDDTSDAALAASQLSLYCAQSVDMNFTPTGSSAYSHDIPTALSTYFNYKRSAKYIQRDVYTSQAWEEILYEELSAGRPVLYSGSKNMSGHEFVCDGYDGNGMFHINWGWNGVSNGYFLLSVLDPDTQGIGSATGSYGYIEGQGMVIGIEPGSGTANGMEVTTDWVEVKSYTATRSSSTYNFSISQVTRFVNRTSLPISFDYGWGVYDTSGRLIQKLNTSYITAMGTNYFINADQTLLFGNGRSSGTFYIKPIYTERNTTNWRPCVGADLNYIKMSIQGNRCVVICEGNGGTPSYEVNDITVTGNMHPSRPVYIKLNVTNTGNSRNNLIYMFAKGRFVSEAFVDMEKGRSGDVNFQYTTRNTGDVELTFSLNRDGSDPIGSKTITIVPMPAATLSGTLEVLNVADSWRDWILGDKFSVKATVTNDGTETYNEDITAYLNKSLLGYYGTPVQSLTRTVSINPGKSVNLQFDFDNVVDGWTYDVVLYFYSQGRDKLLDLTGDYTIYFTETPTLLPGDVNLDGEVNIADVNAVISVIMGTFTDPNIFLEADVDGNGEINIGDVNAIINIILNG